MRVPKLPLLVLLLLWAGHPVPAQDPPPASEPEPVAPLDTFVPSERLPADAEVAFPVDI